MKRNQKKIFPIFMVVSMIFQILVPTIVSAITLDGNTITIGGNPTINGSTFEYSNGDVTITKNNVSVNTTSFTVEKNDEIVISLVPDTGYTAQLHDNNQNNNIELNNNTYSFTIANANSSTISFTPSFFISDPPVEAIKIDFTINGESFTNVSIGDKVVVSNNFNIKAITQFYITKIAIEGVKTYTYSANEYSYDLLDNQGRRLFEVRNFTKISDNSARFGLEIHNNDILEKDIAQGKTKKDYFGLHITNLYLIKDAFRGVEVSTEAMPDNYDFTMWNGADLKGTTKDNPGKVTAYYDEDTINLSSIVSSDISEISLVNDGLVPSSAIEINNETNKITMLSNYYNEIPLKIKLEDGTTGYITVNRIGIFISDINAGNDTFYHGAAAEISGNLNIHTDKNRIAAVFYHEDSTTYEDYDLIVNITYADGKTETTIAEGVGDIHNSNGNIVGSDYVLWKGDIESQPTSVSVTAVKKGTLASDATTFSGATFGSGAGVLWEGR